MRLLVLTLALLSGCIGSIEKMDSRDLCVAYQGFHFDATKDEKREEIMGRRLFDDQYWEYIQKQQICLGMPAMACLCSWGEPWSISSMVGLRLINIYWHYEFTTIRFEDGKISHWMEMR